ncbi:MAG: undecaprenyl-diphosphate phosphatase [Alphaproteobacteria bacterium]|nr:undecaprenyl-diphosphate phosphatase [Alphaproteobacteria bacterium]MDE2341460.1 undecaprenyl-diphosphate phosphatase [Alphaproteobacteria bacterium]
MIVDPLTLTAVELGIVEGVTEFLPVSSTGHLILATKLLGFNADQWDVFNIVIQFGAIMAIVVLYWRTFMDVLQGLLRRESGAMLFTRNLAIAVVPALFLGALLHKRIEALLSNATVVAWSLVIGGVVIILIERFIVPLYGIQQKNPASGNGIAETEKNIEHIPLGHAVMIGFAQCLAMVPGVSRSGATIMGALSLGVERKTAAEFSFFLAVPTMIAASAFQLFTHRHNLGSIGLGLIGIGTIVSFLVALVVVKAFVAVISRAGFTPFALYRIIAGVAALLWLHRIG